MAGCSVPMFEPINASRLLNSRFDGRYPIVLNASVTPTPWAPVVTADVLTAWIEEALVAPTVTAPLWLSVVVVVTSLSTR